MRHRPISPTRLSSLSGRRPKSPEFFIRQILYLENFSFKRNAKAFSLNAIVDGRRRHEMTFWNISETIRAIDFKIYHKVALHSLYISIGNDVINYFRSAANHTNV